jgi:hypothetical protein
MRVCGQREDAEDTMREVLLKSVPHLPRFDSPKALVLWLYKVAKNRFVEVQEMKTSEIPRLERYLKFHLAEILGKLENNHEGDSVAGSTWSSKWGPSACVLKTSLLRSREKINSALVRIREGTYGNCGRCGNEIGLPRLEVVPWAQFCTVCHEESVQHQQAENE